MSVVDSQFSGPCVASGDVSILNYGTGAQVFQLGQYSEFRGPGEESPGRVIFCARWKPSGMTMSQRSRTAGRIKKTDVYEELTKMAEDQSSNE